MEDQTSTTSYKDIFCYRLCSSAQVPTRCPSPPSPHRLRSPRPLPALLLRRRRPWSSAATSPRASDTAWRCAPRRARPAAEERPRDSERHCPLRVTDATHARSRPGLSSEPQISRRGSRTPNAPARRSAARTSPLPDYTSAPLTHVPSQQSRTTVATRTSPRLGRAQTVQSPATRTIHPSRPPPPDLRSLSRGAAKCMARTGCAGAEHTDLLLRYPLDTSRPWRISALL